MRVAATAGQVRLDRLPEAPRDAEGRIELDAIVDALGRDRSILLESTPGTPHAIPWSFIALPSAVRVEDDGRVASWHSPQGTEAIGDDPFRALELVCERLHLDPSATSDTALPPFVGGLVGALSYDLARRIEVLPTRSRVDRDQPHLRFDVVTTLVAVDHRDEEAWLVRREPSGGPSPDEIRTLLRRRGSGRRTAGPPVASSTVTSTLSRAAYHQAVGTLLERIAAGDVFQVNLTQRLTGPWRGDAHGLYRRLRATSPAPHGAVLPALGIASVSPETFLLAADGRLRSRPMKGTRARHPGTDDPGGVALEHSEKDRAENVMVVDMQRNDLGRVCRPGSVTVPRLCELEAHPTVWQLVSTIEGELRAGVGWGEVLRATFPCGSITGAPKVAAMELIEALEPVRRGWYCGAVGWIGAGTMRLSVAIRTAVLSGTAADYGAGGGVVADSDPAAEYDESLAKAGAFLAAVGATADGLDR